MFVSALQQLIESIWSVARRPAYAYVFMLVLMAYPTYRLFLPPGSQDTSATPRFGTLSGLNEIILEGDSFSRGSVRTDASGSVDDGLTSIDVPEGGVVRVLLDAGLGPAGDDGIELYRGRLIVVFSANGKDALKIETHTDQLGGERLIPVFLDLDRLAADFPYSLKVEYLGDPGYEDLNGTVFSSTIVLRKAPRADS